MAESVPALKVVSSLKALRTFRALRPLRLISRLEGMKQVINTLLKSVPSVATVGSSASSTAAKEDSSLRKSIPPRPSQNFYALSVSRRCAF